MERYSAIKQLAVTSAELIEQVQFDDHQGKPEKIEPLLAQIYNFFCQKVHTFLKLPGCLRKFLVGLGGRHEHFDQCLFIKVRKFLFCK